jgi:hypothetical protein
MGAIGSLQEAEPGPWGAKSPLIGFLAQACVVARTLLKAPFA